LVVGVSHRVRELNEGQNPLIETRDKNSVNIASEELMRGKIKIIEDPAEQE
jgi:DNA-directed RNA polymerase subunit K/omega